MIGLWFEIKTLVHWCTAGLQSFLRESEDNEAVATLDEQTINANEKSFVKVHPTWLP